jgi:hypothetical protein
MPKFFFCVLVILVFGFSVLSCRITRQSDVSTGDSVTAGAQNSQNERKQTKSDQSAAESGSLEPEEQETVEKPKEPKSDSSTASSAGKIENRCGWFENPTPGNAWLTDRDGEWIVGAQGGHQAEGDWPDFADNQWVKTNVNYGYGCACLRVKADFKTRRILEIVSATAKSLSACRNDPTLTEPNE